MSDQLSLLEWRPPPELMVIPPNPHQIGFIKAQIRIYREIRSRVLQNLKKEDKLALCRRHESKRLLSMIKACKTQLVRINRNED